MVTWRGMTGGNWEVNQDGRMYSSGKVTPIPEHHKK